MALPIATEAPPTVLDDGLFSMFFGSDVAALDTLPEDLGWLPSPPHWPLDHNAAQRLVNEEIEPSVLSDSPQPAQPVCPPSATAQPEPEPEQGQTGGRRTPALNVDRKNKIQQEKNRWHLLPMPPMPSQHIRTAFLYAELRWFSAALLKSPCLRAVRSMMRAPMPGARKQSTGRVSGSRQSRTVGGSRS